MAPCKLLPYSIINFRSVHPALRSFEGRLLLGLYLLVLFHVSPCELYMRSYYRTISRFSLKGRTHFCFCFCQTLSFYPYSNELSSANSMYNYGRCGVRLRIRTFWVRPTKHRPVSLAIRILLITKPVFQLKILYIRSIKHLCLRHSHL